MQVDSYIEMFTTIFGWLMYNTVWDVLAATGILFLPFLGLVLDNLVDSYSETDGRAGNSDVALRKIEVDVYLAFIVVLIAGNPFIELEPREVSFTPEPTLDLQQQPTINAADTVSSTYGSISFRNEMARPVQVPVWWYVVIQVSKGLTHAIKNGVANKPNLREYIHQLSLMDITDPLLRHEINNFYRDCFVRARSKYYHDLPTFTSAQINIVDSILNTHGHTDIDYIGSRLYLQLPGYYNEFRSKQIVPGFAFDDTRDFEWTRGVEIIPEWGKPTCYDWWVGELGIGGNIGLRSRILTDLDYELDLINIYDSLGSSGLNGDLLIKRVLESRSDLAIWTTRDYDLLKDNNYNEELSGIDSFIIDMLKQILSFFSLAFLSGAFSTLLHLYLDSAHMIQAFFLMMLYGLLPFAILVSRYKLGILMSVAMIIFAVNFWSALWAWASYFDQSLIQAMFPEAGDISELDGGAKYYRKMMLLNFVSGMTYFVLPVVLSIMFTVAGFKAGSTLDNVGGRFTTPIQQHSNSAPSMASKGMKGKVDKIKSLRK